MQVHWKCPNFQNHLQSKNCSHELYCMQRNVLSRDCDSCLHSPFSWWDEGCFLVKVQVWFLGSLECFTSRLLWSPTSLALHPAVEYLAGPGGCLGSPVGLLGFAQHKEFLVAFNTPNPRCSVSALDCSGRSQGRGDFGIFFLISGWLLFQSSAKSRL